MRLLNELLDLFPGLLEKLESQTRVLGIADVREVIDLLQDATLVMGLQRDWRKAVFRLLDCGYSQIYPLHTPSKARLDVRVFPFATYYMYTLLSSSRYGSTVNAEGNPSDDVMLLSVMNGIQEQIKHRSQWRRIDILSRSQAEYEELWEILEDATNLILADKDVKLREFIDCLTIADHYDMFRSVYQSLDPDSLQELSSLTMEQRGYVLDLWQYIIDKQVGNFGDLRRALYRVVRDTHSAGGAQTSTGLSYGRLVALKVLRLFDEESIEPLYQEICKEGILWRQLDHENICPFLGLCSNIFSPRFAMIAPWMPHGDLSTYLHKNPDTDRITIITQIASGLAYLHTQSPQVIHGDMRASNVLIDDQGHARISDFGLSVANTVQTKVTVHSGKGSARWQAPELHFVEGGLSHITLKSDVYAYGMTCYETFTGDIPYVYLPTDGIVVMEVCVRRNKLMRPLANRGLNDRVWNLLQHCWEFDPKKRPDMVDIEAGLKLGLAEYDEKIHIPEETVEEAESDIEATTTFASEFEPGSDSSSDSGSDPESSTSSHSLAWLFQPPSEHTVTRSTTQTIPSFRGKRNTSRIPFYSGYENTVRFVDGRSGNEIDISGLMRLRRAVHDQGMSLSDDPGSDPDAPLSAFPETFGEWINLANLGSATGIGILDRPPPESP